MWRAVRCLTVVLLLMPASHAAGDHAAGDHAALAQAALKQAAVRAEAGWTAPAAGPVAPEGLEIVFVAEDLRNDGILGVAEGLVEAASLLGWSVRVVDSGSTADGRRDAWDKALAARPAAIVAGGTDAALIREEIRRARRLSIPVVGWHATARPGAPGGTDLHVNVTTDPDAVARAAAGFVVDHGEGRAGVVIFTDGRYEIARQKTAIMAQVITECGGCTLLAVEDVAINAAHERMQGVVDGLLDRFGEGWTHALAINDIYFDFAAPALSIKGRGGQSGPWLVSAGDGSAAAFQRIESGYSPQIATVPEPLLLQGWQLADEINRAVAGQPVSGQVAPVYLVSRTQGMEWVSAGRVFDPDLGYRDGYAKLWQR